MDILDKLISLAQLSGKVNVKCEFGGQWAVAHSAQAGQGIVHIVTQGSSYVRLANQAQSRLVKQGDILFFPRSSEHILSYASHCANCETYPTAYTQGAFEVKKIGQQADFGLFCAHFYYDPHAELIKSLPDVIFLRLEPQNFTCFVELLNQEAERELIGSSTIVNALSNVLLTLILRTYLAQSDNQLTGLLKGWQDKRLKGVLNAIMAEPEKPWLIDNMIETAHLSRSQLIRLFKQHLSVSPHVFLHRIRLQKAAMLLKQNADSVLTIALATGFQSETHFGKAFKKYYGITPSQYRKQAVSDNSK
ncbi:hypothetical protein RO21_00135 [[Actinobacillus] muris]|uniref:HTH araC/xylS-type domain-containing protein n=1 Tax=Muribacter muris TaxID=67855 RepID=A0A0J5P8L7_9PAST|nr:AraC family transcriptional regulator [Muribacter muris]KMK52596.1 hypothetical protein RO21_00135 [[Actinobacillus] muris] [Muribacter muris]